MQAVRTYMGFNIHDEWENGNPCKEKSESHVVGTIDVIFFTNLFCFYSFSLRFNNLSVAVF